MRVGLNRVPRPTRQPLADVGQRDLFRRELSLHLLTRRPVWLQLHRIRAYVFVMTVSFSVDFAIADSAFLQQRRCQIG